MAIPSALASQIGVKTETTYGTAVTVDRFFPLVSESFNRQIDRLESRGKIAGRRVIDSDQWAAGNETLSGQVQFELYDHGMGLWLRYCLGAASQTNSGSTYTHTFTPGDLSDDFFTMQIGRPDTGGTVRPFTYAGCMVPSWEIGMSQGEIVTFGADVVASTETTGTALASVSYASDLLPFTFKHGAVSIGGSTANVKELTISGDNGLNADRRFIGSANISQPLESSRREITGQVMMEFEDLTERARFTGGSEFAIEAVLTAGDNTATFTFNARYDGGDVNVPDDGNLEITLPFKAIGDGSDADAFTVVLVNPDTTP